MNKFVKSCSFWVATISCLITAVLPSISWGQSDEITTVHEYEVAQFETFIYDSLEAKFDYYPERGTAWVNVVAFEPSLNYLEEKSTGHYYGFSVPGLAYNKEKKSLIFTDAKGAATVCATVAPKGWLFHDETLKDAEKCKLYVKKFSKNNLDYVGVFLLILK